MKQTINNVKHRAPSPPNGFLTTGDMAIGLLNLEASTYHMVLKSEDILLPRMLKLSKRGGIS